MKLPKRTFLVLWLASAVATIAIISHVLRQPHDLTLVAFLISVCMLALDYFTAPRNGK